MNQQNQSDFQLLLTPRQAADALAISERKLWGLTDRKQIPHVRIGRSVRYSIIDLEQWIAERTQTNEKRV